jgi:hypothetical protein
MGRAPEAVVSRRWKDADEVGRIASEVLERTLNFQLATCDFPDLMQAIRTDFLLFARGVVWVRYEPHMETVQPAIGHNGGPSIDAEDGDQDEGGEAGETEQQATKDGEVTDGAQPYKRVIWEEVVFEHLSWSDFLHSVARKWSEVRWVCRIAYMTRDELKKRFTKLASGAAGGKTLGEVIPLDHKADTGDDGGPDDDQWSKAAIYEIWDKVSRTRIWVSKAWTADVLDEKSDPFELKDFFPMPRPAQGTTGPNSYIPRPDWVYYESQLRDIDVLTERAGKLAEALKLKGFYAAGGEAKDSLANLMKAGDNTMTPIEGWAAFMENGGIEKMVQWMPLEMIANAYKATIEAKTQLKTEMYEITGLSDIMRGEADPDETATATAAKTNWGSIRVREKQKELARFWGDLIGIAGQIAASKFDPKTLGEMSNVQLFPTIQEKQLAQQQVQLNAQAAQQAQANMQAYQAAQQQQQQGQGAPGAPGAPPAAPPPMLGPPPAPPPQLLAMLGKPTWEEVEAILRTNTTRAFEISIETDSTIEPNDQDEKQRQVEFTEAVGKLVQSMLPLVQVAPSLLEMATALLLSLVRRFRAGRELEDVIERAMDQFQQAATQGGGQQQQQPPPGPNPQVEAMKGQAAVTSAQARAMDAQTNAMRAQTERGAAIAGAQLDQQRIAAEQQRTEADRQADVHMHGQGLAADFNQAILKAETRQAAHDITHQTPIQAPTR